MWLNGSGKPRICVIGAGPSGLTTLKNILAGGLRDVVCFEESDAIGGNWVFREETNRMSVYEATHIISSKALSEFEDFPMPHDYPDFPSHRQVLAYFENYAEHFGLRPYIKFKTRVTQASLAADGKWLVQVEGPDGPAGAFRLHYGCARASPRALDPFLPGTLYRPVAAFLRLSEGGSISAAKTCLLSAPGIRRVTSLTTFRGLPPHMHQHATARYIVPKLISGFPINVFLLFSLFKKPIVPALFRFLLRVHIGAYEPGIRTASAYSQSSKHTSKHSIPVSSKAFAALSIVLPRIRESTIRG